MTLLLQDQEIRELFNMDDAIEAMRAAFQEHARGTTANQTRNVYTISSPTKDLNYISNIICGASSEKGMAITRVGSNLVWKGPQGEGSATRREYRPKQPRDMSLVLCYSLETGELQAIMQNVHLSDVRVGATTALAMEHLSREDSSTLGILGSGPQARVSLEGILKVRPIEKAKVYSPNEQRRTSFAQRMTEEFGIEVVPVESTEEAIRGVDILSSNTNTLSQPVFGGDMLEPGQTVSTITNSDPVAFRSETDERTFVRSDLIVINHKAAVLADRQIEMLHPIEKQMMTWDKIKELGEVVSGQTPGRQNRDEIIYYKNNTGMAIQWAVPTAIVLERAREAGIGRELPSEWFFTDLSS